MTLDGENLENFENPVQQTLTIDVDQAPAITSPAAASLGEGVASSFTVTTSGFPAAALGLSGDLPSGVSFTDNGDGTATIAGTPTDTTLTSYPVVVTASSEAGTTAQSLTVTVGPPPDVHLDGARDVRGHDTAGSFTIQTGTAPAGQQVAIATADSLPSGLRR